MAFWLLKTEPKTYSWDDLTRDKKTAWDGVANALALKHLRAMHKGDQAVIYHTGDERAGVGVVDVVSEPYADPSESDPKLVVVDVKPRRRFARAVGLDEIKSDPVFQGWDLLRIGRLSVVPVPDSMWKHLEMLAASV